MFRSFVVMLLLSWVFFAGCEKKQAEKMDEPTNKVESVEDSADTTSVTEDEMGTPEDSIEE